jgi:hypothetical protein
LYKNFIKIKQKGKEMKNIIVKSVLTLLMIIEFYPIESNSQDLPEGKNFSNTVEITQPVNESIELTGPESILYGDAAKIKFLIINEGKVDLGVYGMEGELIETLADGYMEPGEYIVYFKALNEMLPGQYNCKLQYNNKEINKGIVLLK